MNKRSMLCISCLNVSNKCKQLEACKSWSVSKYASRKRAYEFRWLFLFRCPPWQSDSVVKLAKLLTAVRGWVTGSVHYMLLALLPRVFVVECTYAGAWIELWNVFFLCRVSVRIYAIYITVLYHVIVHCMLQYECMCVSCIC